MVSEAGLVEGGRERRESRDTHRLSASAGSFFVAV